MKRYENMMRKHHEWMAKAKVVCFPSTLNRRKINEEVGPEFKKAVNSFCVKNNINLIKVGMISWCDSAVADFFQSDNLRTPQRRDSSESLCNGLRQHSADPKKL